MKDLVAGARLDATLISWLIFGVGILFLVLAAKKRIDLRPNLNAGIYKYAKEGFGNYAGFNIWGHAKNSNDVGKAGIIGFLLTLVLYALISVLSGIMKQPELAKLNDPSLAYVLKMAVGEWAVSFVVIWILLRSQVPFTAAQVKILSTSFLKQNKQETPVYGLFISSIIMQVFMVLVVTAKSVYNMAIDITKVMILPAFLFHGSFPVKASYTGKLNIMATLCRKFNFTVNYLHFLPRRCIHLCFCPQAKYVFQ